MKISRLYCWFYGYLTVCADGPFPERLINICLHRGMYIFDIKRYGSNRIIFKIDVKSFFDIRIPARRTKSHIKILKRSGLPFIIQKYKKRRFVLAGIIILVAILWYASNHIMGITIYGNNRIATDTINNALEECGLTLGTKTSDIKPDILRNRLMIKLPDLAWVGINANGSRVYIEIVERIEKEQGVDKYAPACDLVASKDGEIERIEVREGQTVCKIGSGVRKGDVLVSGIVDSPVKGFDYVRARGEVYAKTRYSLTRCYPLEYTEENYTGNKKNKYILKVFGKDLPLYLFSKIPYKEYILNENTAEYKTPIDIIPSVFITKKEYNEITKEIKTSTPNEAKDRGGAELIQEIKNSLSEGTEIIEENVSYTLNEKNEAEVTAEIICRENIAEEYVIEVAE